jgi:hypothetical protein
MAPLYELKIIHFDFSLGQDSAGFYFEAPFERLLATDKRPPLTDYTSKSYHKVDFPPRSWRYGPLRGDRSRHTHKRGVELSVTRICIESSIAKFLRHGDGERGLVLGYSHLDRDVIHTR